MITCTDIQVSDEVLPTRLVPCRFMILLRMQSNTTLFRKKLPDIESFGWKQPPHCAIHLQRNSGRVLLPSTNPTAEYQNQYARCSEGKVDDRNHGIFYSEHSSDHSARLEGQGDMAEWLNWYIVCPTLQPPHHPPPLWLNRGVSAAWRSSKQTSGAGAPFHLWVIQNVAAWSGNSRCFVQFSRSIEVVKTAM